MKNSISILYMAAVLTIGAGLASCEKIGPGMEEPDTPTFEQEFTFGTRADQVTGDPLHGDPYTMVSYRVGGTASTYVDKYLIRENYADGRQWGYYAYDDGVISGRPAGTLVPVAMQFPGNNNNTYTIPYMYYPTGWTTGGELTKNGRQAQMLNGVPVAGSNPATNQGVFRVAMIHPAIPMRSAQNSNLGFLAVYGLGDDIYASMPDDADGNGVQDDPFEITVTSNGQVHPLPAKTELHPVKSAVKVWFYSEYYADSDPGQTSPQTQTFSIASLRLYNVGSNGWYNARTGIVYPNYNYNTNWRTVHSLDEGGTSIPNYVDLAGGVTPDNATAGPGKTGIPIQWTAETPVFPSDYRGPENGGLAEVKPLAMFIELDMGGGALNKASVPISLKMERGKRYNFYVNVISELIAITYNVSPWEDGGESTDDIGGDKLPYATIDLEYTPGGWDSGGGGDDEIGG